MTNQPASPPRAPGRRGRDLLIGAALGGIAVLACLGLACAAAWQVLSLGSTTDSVATVLSQQTARPPAYPTEANAIPADTATPEPSRTPTPTPTPTPLPSPTQTRQLDTGAIVKLVGIAGGLGKLTVENGLEQDAVAVLSHGKSFLMAVYIRRGETGALGGIPDGSYELFFTLGQDWDPDAGAFTRHRDLARFDDPFEFTSTSTSYPIWTVTLHPVEGGTATWRDIPEEQFPDLAP